MVARKAGVCQGEVCRAGVHEAGAGKLEFMRLEFVGLARSNHWRIGRECWDGSFGTRNRGSLVYAAAPGRGSRGPIVRNCKHAKL